MKSPVIITNPANPSDFIQFGNLSIITGPNNGGKSFLLNQTRIGRKSVEHTKFKTHHLTRMLQDHQVNLLPDNLKHLNNNLRMSSNTKLLINLIPFLLDPKSKGHTLLLDDVCNNFTSNYLTIIANTIITAAKTKQIIITTTSIKLINLLQIHADTIIVANNPHITVLNKDDIQRLSNLHTSITNAPIIQNNI